MPYKPLEVTFCRECYDAIKPEIRDILREAGVSIRVIYSVKPGKLYPLETGRPFNQRQETLKNNPHPDDEQK